MKIEQLSKFFSSLSQQRKYTYQYVPYNETQLQNVVPTNKFIVLFHIIFIIY